MRRSSTTSTSSSRRSLAGNSRKPVVERQQQRRVSGFLRELAAARKAGEEKEDAAGFCPLELSEWILAKVASDKTVDSVYLVPAAAQEDSTAAGAAGAAGAASNNSQHYRYTLVGSEEAMNKKHFLTLSSRGVNEFLNNDVRFLDLAEWKTEYERYLRLCKLKFFKQFRLLKGFRTWHGVVRRHKFVTVSRLLTERHCALGNKHMRGCLIKLWSHFARISAMGITEISSHSTKHINDFHTQQIEQLAKFRANFTNFRGMVAGMVLEAAKATFTEAGFSYDDYAAEVLAYGASGGGAGAASTLSGISGLQQQEQQQQQQQLPQPRKLTFIEQANKRQCCLLIISFVRLVDAIMRHTLHRLACNSVIAIQKPITQRSRNEIPSSEGTSGDGSSGGQNNQSSSGAAGGEKHKSSLNLSSGDAQVRKSSQQRSASKSGGGGTTGGTEEEEQVVPVFSLTIGVSEDQRITYTPDITVFEGHFSDFVRAINETLAGIPLLVHDRMFRPFTQPILYGKMENYRPSEQSVFLDGHHEKCSALLNKLAYITASAFELCEVAMQPYTKTAFEFCRASKEAEGGGGDGSSESGSNLGGRSKAEEAIETDVEVLKATLASLQEQQNSIRSIRDSRTVAFFKVDLRLFKRTVLPNISRAIVRLQESLPKVGREKMERFAEDARELRETIDFEPKSSEDYVRNADVVERIHAKFDALESELEAIENVYGIMAEIPIPVSADDRASLKALKANMNALGQKIAERLRAQAGVRPLFKEQLEHEIRQLKEVIREALKDIRQPGLLEAEASIEEIKPVLKKMEVVLGEAREKAKRYRGYEESYFGDVCSPTEYPDLESAEVTLRALETLWQGCVERWDRLYDEWSAANFDALDVAGECSRSTADVHRKLQAAREVLGENPIVQELHDKVTTMLDNIPCLLDLKATCLRERHWRAISEAINADVRPHKITMGFLEQNGAFAYAAQVARIVRSAEMEHQLDGLVEDLKRSWTENRLDMTPRHGISSVRDFTQLHETVDRSLTTLRQLGSSQYSTAMRAQLLEWFQIVDGAAAAVDVIQAAQEKWLRQDMALSSMAFEEEVPLTFQLFQTLRSRLATCFEALARADSLIAVFRDSQRLLRAVGDVSLGLDETEASLDSALWALRMASPGLFFLTDGELLDLMSVSYHDIGATEHYLGKIFPWFSKLVLVEGTENLVTERGYNPIVLGTLALDGEQLTFDEPMTARLEADYWIKCINLGVKHTLRRHSRNFFERLKIRDLLEAWRQPATLASMPVQILVASTHVLFSQRLALQRDEMSKTSLETTVRDLLSLSTDALGRAETPVQRRREEVRLLLAQYYGDLMVGNSAVQKGKNGAEAHPENLVTYLHDDKRSVLKVRAFNKTYVYGYQYLAQGVCFSPDLNFSRNAHRLLSCVNLKYVTYHHNSLGPTLVRQAAGLFGRRLHVYTPGCDKDFRGLVIGTLACGNWLTLGPRETLREEEFSFLVDLFQQVRGRQQYGGSRLDVHRRQVPIAEGFHFNLTFWRTSGEGADSLSRTLFRDPSLVPIPRDVALRLALQRKGAADGGVSALRELSFLAQALSAASVDRAKADMMHSKMLSAIALSDRGRPREIYRWFLDLGARAMLADMEVPHAFLPTVFKEELSRQISLDASVAETASSDATHKVSPSSATEVENFVRLEKSVLSGGAASAHLTVARATFSLVEAKSVALLRAHVTQRGSRFLRVDLETQVRDADFSRVLFKGQPNFLDGALLVVRGFFGGDEYETVKFHVRENNFSGLKVLLQDADYDANFARGLEEANWMELRQGPRCVARRHLVQGLQEEESERLLSDFSEEQMEWLLEVVLEVVQAEEERAREEGGGEKAGITVESLSITFVAVYADFKKEMEKQNKEEDGGEARERTLTEIVVLCLVRCLAYLLPMGKVKALLRMMEKYMADKFEGGGAKLKTMLGETVENMEKEIQEQRPQLQQQEAYKQRRLRPELSVGGGGADLFVPTAEMDRAVRAVRFYLEHGVGVLMRGEKACGKSTAMHKAVEEISGPSPPHRVLFLYFGGAKTSFRTEDAVLAAAETHTKENAGKRCLVVVEGFDPTLEAHVSYVLSMASGRTLYFREREDFVALPRFTVCVEALSKGEWAGERDLSHHLRGYLVPVSVRKPFDDDSFILTKALTVFSKDFSEELQNNIQEIKSFVVGWHKFARNRFPSAGISDHALYRLISGVLLSSPEEVSNISDMCRHLLNEMESEYSPYMNGKKIDDLLEEFSPYFKGKFFKELEDLASYFVSTNKGKGCHLELRERGAVLENFQHEYDEFKGKSFNNSMTLTDQACGNLVNLVRSYHRFDCTIVVGPAGSGKGASVDFVSKMLHLKLVESPKSFKEFEKTFKGAFARALKGHKMMLYVKLLRDFGEILTLVEDFLFYCDPSFFTPAERMSQLFPDKEREYNALCDNSKYSEAVAAKQRKVHQNLHLVLDMEEGAYETHCRARRPHLHLRSGVVTFHRWSPESLRAIVTERLEAAEEEDRRQRAAAASDKNGASGKKEGMPVETVASLLARLHEEETVLDPTVASSQFLDAAAIFPEFYRPQAREMRQKEEDYLSGIQSVLRSNGYIDKLARETADKEPQVAQLTAEIEQLNKRLAQERGNLDKASKSFRRIEVAARKKSEETQELAADAHRNLEHALPSLEAAMVAIGDIDRQEFLDMRLIKAPPEALQQVMEAVCILLGVKADWTTAKVVLGDPQFQQRLLEIDKDNISEQVSKRIRRYIENPKFVPDEVAKASKQGVALCMWVRALDLYTKIFKSIEPKRIKLLQAESELAELMTALREETDRVAHTENSIAGVQADLQEKTRRRASVEESIKQTGVRLERARVLAYSLEEESKHWRQLLAGVKERQRVLVGEAVVAAVVAAYGCGRPEGERAEALKRWRQTCEDAGVSTDASGEIFLSFFGQNRLLTSWLSAFEQYNQNYLSILSTNKWSVLLDPHDLGLNYLRDQNPALQVVDFRDDGLAETIKFAVSKGSEVLVTNFALPPPPDLRDLFERRLHEHVHAFVGVVGIPVMRKDMRVNIGTSEVVCHSKFFLHLHCTGGAEVERDLARGAKVYNVVRFGYDAAAMRKRMMALVMRCARFSEAERYDKLHASIDALERSVRERKEVVLSILLEAGEAMLDDQSLISGLKEAKAKVFEALTDLDGERKELSALKTLCPVYETAAERLAALSDMCESLRLRDPSFEFVPAYVFKELEGSEHPIDVLCAEVSRQCVARLVLSLHKDFRPHLAVFGAAVSEVSAEELPKIMDAFEEALDRGDDWKDEMEVVDFAASKLHSLRSHEFRRSASEAISLLITEEESTATALLRASSVRPTFILNDPADVSSHMPSIDLLFWLARRERTTRPKLITLKDWMVSGEEEGRPRMAPGALRDLNTLVQNCARERRWIIIDSAAPLSPRMAELKAIASSGSSSSRIFLLANHREALGARLRDRCEVVSAVLPAARRTREAFLRQLLKLEEEEEDDGGTKKSEEKLGRLVSLHLDVSESEGRFQSLKCMEVMGAKTCGEGSPRSGERLRGLVADVYAVRKESLQKFEWEV